MQTYTFGDKFTILKKSVEEAVVLRLHLRSMGLKVINPSPIFVDKMSVVLNANIPGISWNKKTVELSCHFEREHVANGMV